MPQAHRNTTQLIQAQALKPWAMPYHGTKTSVASGVSVKTVVVTQLIGACSAGGEAVFISGLPCGGHGNSFVILQGWGGGRAGIAGY